MHEDTSAHLPSWPYLWRKIPAGTRGKHRLARLTLGTLLRRRNVDIAVGDLQFRVPTLVEPLAYCLLVDGEYEAATLAFLTKHLGRESTFVDIGANVGMFSVLAAKRLCPQGKVLAIEASPTVFQCLARNQLQNKAGNLLIENVAATADDGGTVPFFEATPDKFGMGSLTPRFKGEPAHVARASLDSLLEKHRIDRVDAIKVDVEGYERGVFAGASKLLKGPHAPPIVFEFNDWAEASAEGCTKGDAQEFLRSAGYTLWTLPSYLAGGAPMREIMTSGFSDLVALKI